MRSRYFKATKKDIKYSKCRKTGTVRECDGTTNPGGTRKPNNPLKGICNPISRNPDNPIKVIQDLVQNETRSHWPREFTVPT